MRPGNQVRNRSGLTPVARLQGNCKTLNVLHRHQSSRRSKVAHAVPAGPRDAVPHRALSIPVHPQGHRRRAAAAQPESSPSPDGDKQPRPAPTSPPPNICPATAQHRLFRRREGCALLCGCEPAPRRHRHSAIYRMTLDESSSARLTGREIHCSSLRDLNRPDIYQSAPSIFV